MLHILASGQYHQAIRDDDPSNDLREALAIATRERFRRIDRFTQLSIIGAHRCIGVKELPANTGLYLGSRYAPITTTVKVHKHMLQKKQLPKPAHFVNTLSNSAGYYIARNFGLQGKNLFISRPDASTEAVLQLVALDFAAGEADVALIGLVDEIGPCAAEHRRRLEVADDTAIAEASCWFLLAAESQPEQLASIKKTATLANRLKLDTWLEDALADGNGADTVFYASCADAEEAILARLGPQARLDYHPDAYSPEASALAIQHFIASDSNAKQLLTVVADAAGRYHCCQVTRPL